MTETVLQIREALVAVHARPDDPDRSSHLARLWLELGKPNVALTWIHQARSLAGDDRYETLYQAIRKEAHHHRARGHSGRGGPKTALIRLNKFEIPTEDAEPSPFDIATAIDEPSAAGPSLGVAHVDPAEVAIVEEGMTAFLPGQVAPVELQMDALLGASLFGSDRRTALFAPPPVRATGLGRRAVMAAAAMVVLVGGYGAVDAGLTRIKQREYAVALRDLRELLSVGAYARAATVLPDAERLADRVQTVPHQSFAEAHAALYRFYDADPARLHRIDVHRSFPGDFRLVDALLASNLELVSMRGTLQLIDDDDPRRLNLIARGAARAGAQRSAADSFERSESLQPANLVHLYFFAQYFASLDLQTDLEDLRAQMGDVEPDSPWTIAASEEPEELDDAPRVPRAVLLLSLALRRSEQGDDAGAAAAAAEARRLFSGSSAWMIDAADRLLAESVDLAVLFVAEPSWPKTVAANAVEGKILLAQGAHARAVQKLRIAVDGGIDAPDVHLALADALLASGDVEAGLAALSASTRRWPDRQDLALHEATALLSLGRGAQASDRAQTIARSTRDRPTRARAFALMAAVALVDGDAKLARRRARQALRNDRLNERARRILKATAKKKKRRRRRRR